MSDNLYMPDNPYMNIGKQASNPYMDLGKQQKGITETDPQLFGGMRPVGFLPKEIEPVGAPLKETYPTLYAAGKTAMDMPGLVGKAGMSVISGATWSLPERAEEAGNWLARTLFGEGRKGGATGSWKEESQLHPYVEKGLRFGGQMINIHTLGKAVAAPIIGTIIKHPGWAPFARMIGWGAAGATYQAGERMLGEGELPTPQELLKSGGTWAAIEGIMSSLGWTGRLAVGLNRLSKTWTIPKKEVLKIVTKEAKERGMPFAKYIYAKAGVQKALSLKEKASAKEFLNMVDDLVVPFKKQGTYADLVKQLEKESVESRIKSFETHAHKPAKVIIPVPKPKPTQRIDMLRMGETRGKILTEDLPDWIQKVTDDIRYGTPVSGTLQKKYHDFFLARAKPGSVAKPITPKVPSKKVVPSTLTKKIPVMQEPGIEKIYKQQTTVKAIEQLREGRFWGKRKIVSASKSPIDSPDVEGNIRIVLKDKGQFKRRDIYFKGEDEVISRVPVKFTPNDIIEFQVKDPKTIERFKMFLPKQYEGIPVKDWEKGLTGRGKAVKALPETIKAKGAALKFPDGTIITGQTHAVAYQKALNKGLEKQLDKGFEEGFVTTSNKFITRDQATVLYRVNETNALLKKGVIEGFKASKKQTKARLEEVWRAETGFKHDKGTTAADVVRYEQVELGNKLGVSAAKIKELENYSAENLRWVTTTKKAGLKYGKPKKTPIGKQTELIARDGEGGLLLLDKTKSTGTTLGFGPTGELQNIYEKLAKKGLIKRKGGKTIIPEIITATDEPAMLKYHPKTAKEVQAKIAKAKVVLKEQAAKIKTVTKFEGFGALDDKKIEFIHHIMHKRNKTLLQAKTIADKFYNREIDARGVKALLAKEVKGTTLGFGPTSQLQNIYEKLMAGRLHKPLKKKMGDAILRKLTPDAQLVMDALKKIKPLSTKQKEIYSLERGKRLTEAIKLRGTTSGERGYHTELKALEGPMEHLEFEPVRQLITQKTVNNLMNEIRDCPVLSNWETYPARKALAQILQGSMPTEGGQTLLRDVFGKKFVDELVKKKALWLKVKEAGIMAVNFPKAIKSSYDLSAPLRQGIFMLRRYKQWLPAFRDMFKYFGSKEAYHESTLNIRRHHNYKLAKEHKLALTDLGSITSREEAFMSSWAEKIPGVGASARAYTGFLNQLRFDVFNDFIKKGQQLGLLKNEKYLRTAAKYINHATGRGHLMGLEGAATELNAVFFSPRLIMSRLQLVNPVFYIKLEKHVRKEALKDLFAFTGLTCSVGALAKKAGLDVEIDPRSADFMKIRVGNKRFDTLGGLQQTIRTVAQFTTGEVISTTTGKTLTLGEGYKPMTRLGVAGRFLQYKLAPVSSFAVTLLTGQATMGGKLDIPTEIGRLFAPMAAQDMYELYDDEGLSAIPLATPAFFGVGLQTYGGVSTYGLSGKNYKTLNTELSRLKTSLGFPSTSVYGQELTNKEYKVFKNKAGKEIARSVENVMKTSFYKKANDDGKRHIVDKVIDHTKEKVRRELFKKYMFIQQRAAAIRKATYKPVQETRKIAREQVDKLMKGK